MTTRSSRPLVPQTLQSLLAACPDVHTAAPVILCIGTDRIIGDCLGPMVGSLLVKEAGSRLPVYGTLQNPVHALNLEEINSRIKREHPGRTTIAVDASLGDPDEVGSVYVCTGGLYPGAGVSKSLPPSGDISITGIAAPQSRQPYLALQTARLSTIASMADTICGCLLSLCR